MDHRVADEYDLTERDNEIVKVIGKELEISFEGISESVREEDTVMNDIEAREIKEAIDAADNALDHLRSARRYLDSAGNWGLLDMFGGGLLSGLMKHSKMSDAEREIDNARYSLQRFSEELRDVSGYSSIHIDDFLSFADFFFDGFVADILVQSKISSGKKQCDDAIRRVESIRAELQDKLRDQY